MRIFTSYKPFVGRVGEIQMLARENWKSRFPSAEIADVQGESGPPDFAQIAARASAGEIALYCNGDILFESGVETVLSNLPDGDFLAVGQRIDWLEDGTRERHRPSGMDYFFFRGGMFADLPPTVVGRAYYDSALVAWALRKGLPVIDLTPALKVVHQWHDYGHVKDGRKGVFAGTDARANKTNNNLPHFGPHIADAGFMMTREGKIVPNARLGRLRRSGRWGLWNVLTRGGRLWNRWWPW